MRSTFLLLFWAGAALGDMPADLQTVAGTGRPGYTGDGGPALQATLREPFHCDLSRGNLYIADALNHSIRKLSLRSGTISTVAGNGRKGYTGDDGPATQATLNEPYAVVVGPAGDLYIVDRLNAVIRHVDATGHIRTLAGTGQKRYGGDGGKAALAMLREPNDCVLDGKDSLLIADVGDGRIRRIDLQTGIITTFAGIGRRPGKIDRNRLGDGGPATRALLVGARAVCVDDKGNTYICEREGNAIRKVDAHGIISTVAGTGAKGYTGDGGDAHQATFNGPKGIRCDRHGNVYVVDTENQAVRRIDARTNKITTVVSGLDRPHGCIIDAEGAVYIADTLHHRVVKVAAAHQTAREKLPLLFADNFANGADHWQPTDPKAWKILQTDKGKVYSQFQQSKYEPPYRSPFNYSLVKDYTVGDFILEAKVQSTAKDYPHRDMCLFFGYQDAAHFYYVHLGQKTDDHANQIFIVKAAPRQKISTKTTSGTKWDARWHQVKIIRRVGTGTVQVYFDNMQDPVMTATDRTFTWGRVGLGSFDDTGNWADVKLHGVKAERK